jgi:hypothetical protein
MITLFLITNLLAQKGNFKQAELQGKTWQLQGVTGFNEEYIYENDIPSFSIDGKNIGNMEYYLSDSIVKTFNSTKVGNIKEGKYIIKRPIRAIGDTNPPLRVSVVEIVELSRYKLILRGVKNSNLVEFKAR